MSLRLVDTHCHLVLLEQRGLLEQALSNAFSAGVEQLVTVGLDVDDSDRNRQLAERYPGVFFTVGWHPHQLAPPDPAQLAALDELLAHPRAVAVGEVGLDAFFRPGYHQTPLEMQRRGLEAMLELATRHHKPVVIHDRDTHELVLEVLSGRGLNGVMHCFSGDAGFGARCVDAGMHLSFSGIVTFARSEGIQAAARGVPSGRLLLETDSPFLAPVPHRGEPNQPGYVAATAAAVAALRDEPVEAVAAAAAAAARELFGLPDPAGGDCLRG